jgi:hypothetical protein
MHVNEDSTTARDNYRTPLNAYLEQFVDAASG